MNRATPPALFAFCYFWNRVLLLCSPHGFLDGKPGIEHSPLSSTVGLYERLAVWLTRNAFMTDFHLSLLLTLVFTEILGWPLCVIRNIKSLGVLPYRVLFSTLVAVLT
jgi:hypothetical protein